MATKTTNYNLTKPDLEDYADIRVLNANMDIIDSEMKAIAKLAQNNTGSGGEQVDLSDYALKTQLDNYLPLTGGNCSGMITINGKEVMLKEPTKQGTTKNNEPSFWKTYLPDGRVMFKVTTKGQKVLTLPVVMANTQYTVIQCDNSIITPDIPNQGTDYSTTDSTIAYICNRGISDKTTTSFKLWNVCRVGNTEYKSAGWDNYRGYTQGVGGCDAIIIGWEA